MFEFSWGSTVTPTPYAYPNLLNKKASTPSERKYHIVCTIFLVFCWCRWKLVMANDVATPSNPPVALVDKEELEKTSLDEVALEVNVSQRSCEEEPSRRVVRTWVDRSAWDRQLSPNPHALAIYLEFIRARRATPKRFEECQCKDDDVRLHCQTWVPGDGHYRWLQRPINPLPMEHRAEYLARTIRRILEFLQLWPIPFKLFTKL